MKRIDRTGQRYGRLVAQASRSIEAGDRVRIFWDCICDCGNRVSVNTDSLARGLSESCGCIRVEMTRARSLTHGATSGRVKSREYRAWRHAKDRCHNPRDSNFRRYGARGIVMCARWRDDFATFLADMGPCPPGLSIDRIDVNGPYAPENCRWATDSVQANNTRANRYVEHEGARFSLAQLAAHFGVSYKAMHYHVIRGLDPVVAAQRLAAKKG